jgi:ribosomal protein L3 glutamine methyltransferase
LTQHYAGFLQGGVALNISDWITHAEQQFRTAGLYYGHGTDNANDEAVWLVLHVVGGALDGSFDQWQLKVTATQAARIVDLTQRRVMSKKPLAYLLGSAWFAGLEFEVNEQVLVPRSPIAELVEEQYSPWLAPLHLKNVLDLCTGSGCIAIATAVYLPGVLVDASDISAEALQVAQRNVQRHGVESRVRLIQSDLFSGLSGQTYDLIVTNPPYVARQMEAELPAEFHAEPGLGLYSGVDGLDLCLRIMLQSPHHLREGGILICEVGESADRLAAALPAVPFLWLDFRYGGEGVFLMSREVLLQAASSLAVLIEERNRVG